MLERALEKMLGKAKVDSNGGIPEPDEE